MTDVVDAFSCLLLGVIFFATLIVLDCYMCYTCPCALWHCRCTLPLSSSLWAYGCRSASRPDGLTLTNIRLACWVGYVSIHDLNRLVPSLPTPAPSLPNCNRSLANPVDPLVPALCWCHLLLLASRWPEWLSSCLGLVLPLSPTVWGALCAAARLLGTRVWRAPLSPSPLPLAGPFVPGPPLPTPLDPPTIRALGQPADPALWRRSVSTLVRACARVLHRSSACHATRDGSRSLCHYLVLWLWVLHSQTLA